MSKKVRKTVEEFLEGAIVPEEEQPYVVPENWVWVRLGAVIEINPPKTKLDNIDDEQVSSFVPMASVSEKTGRIEYIEERAYEKVKKGYTQFFDDDILFAKITPCMENGKVAIAENLLNKFGYGSTEFYVLRTNEHIDTKFVYHLVRSEYFRKRAKGNMTGAVGQQRVPKKYLESYPISLPPLNEQKRIADKVERLLNKIDEAKQLIDEAKETFELRRAATLDKAFRGDLTANWRQVNKSIEPVHILLESIKEKKFNSEIKINTDKIKSIEKVDEPFSLPDGWIWVKLGELAFYVTSGSRDWSKYYSDSGAYFIRTQDINTNKLILDNVAYMELPEKVEGKRSLIEKNDLLTTITGANVGKCARIDYELPEAYVSQSVALTKLVDTRLSKYLHYSLISPCGGGGELKERAYGIGRPVLSLEDVKNIKIPLAPIDEQREIINKIEHLLANEESALLLINLDEKIDELRNSILSKAFRGELGTNDPTEESAIELLKEQIK